MKYVYWDSCCFISHLEGEERAEQLIGIIQRAQRNELKIVTSAISLTEVLGKRNIAPEDRTAIKEGMSSKNGILFVDLTEHLAKAARDFIWEREYHSHSKDAVHLVTALYYNQLNSLDEIHTFDDDLLRFGDSLGIPIVKPSLQEYPEMQRELPFDDASTVSFSNLQNTN